MDLSAIVSRFGTPVYVYNLDEVVSSVRRLRTTLPPGTRIYYSLKANPHPDLVRALAAAGCHAEVTSSGEVDTALAAGVEPENCLYTGPGKSAQDLAYALERGVTFFSVESGTDLRRLAATTQARNTEAQCLIRVNGSAAGGSGLRMTGTASQFGVGLGDVPALVEAAAELPCVRIIGAHFYSISNAPTEDGLIAEFRSSIRAAIWLRDQGLPLDVLDIGGGFAAPFARVGDPVAYPALAEALAAELDAHLNGRTLVAVETGRHLVAAAGTLLTTVLDVKDSHGNRFAVLDAGINQLGGLSGLRRLLPMSAQPVEAVGDPAGTPVDLAGPLCTPLDMLGRGLGLPGLAPGDVLTIPNVGAYGLTASLLGFLSHPVAAEVTVVDGRVRSASRIELRRIPLEVRR